MVLILCLRGDGDGLGGSCGVGRLIVHLHGVVLALGRAGLALLFLLFLDLLVAALAFEVDAAVFGHLVLLVIGGLATVGLGTAHLGVLALGFGLLGRFLGSLLSGLLGTVLFFVGGEISLGLLRGVLGRSGCFRIPGTESVYVTEHGFAGEL